MTSTQCLDYIIHAIRRLVKLPVSFATGSTPAQIACADYDGGNRVVVYNTSRMYIHVRDDTIFFNQESESK